MLRPSPTVASSTGAHCGRLCSSVGNGAFLRLLDLLLCRPRLFVRCRRRCAVPLSQRSNERTTTSATTPHDAPNRISDRSTHRSANPHRHPSRPLCAAPRRPASARCAQMQHEQQRPATSADHDSSSHHAAAPADDTRAVCLLPFDCGCGCSSLLLRLTRHLSQQKSIGRQIRQAMEMTMAERGTEELTPSAANHLPPPSASAATSAVRSAPLVCFSAAAPADSSAARMTMANLNQFPSSSSHAGLIHPLMRLPTRSAGESSQSRAILQPPLPQTNRVHTPAAAASSPHSPSTCMACQESFQIGEQTIASVSNKRAHAEEKARGARRRRRRRLHATTAAPV